MMKVLNFGSMNLDHVYSVDHFVRPGETLAVTGRALKFGGKGLNQSIALARAGARVFHAGCVGEGGENLKQRLERDGVDTSLIREVDDAQGHALIQVDPRGENSILLYGGSNRRVTKEQVTFTLDRFSPGDWLVLQNEISLLPFIVDEAHARGLIIALNPSPYDPSLRDVDFSKLSWVLLNALEAFEITGEKDPDAAFDRLHALWPRLSAVITLGSQGSAARRVTNEGVERARIPAEKVTAVDTTGAGDTYTGYFIAGLMEGLPLRECMERAGRAAAVSVTRPGAADSIPLRAELD